MKRLTLLSFLMISVMGYSQISQIKQFPHPASSGKYKVSNLLYHNNTYYMFYFDSLLQADTGSTRLMFSKSTDGTNWDNGTQLSPSFRITYPVLDLAACTFQNKIVVIFKGVNGQNYMVYSDDGITWSVMEKIYFSNMGTALSFSNYSLSSDADSIYLSGTSGTAADVRIVSSSNLTGWKYWTIPMQGKRSTMLAVENGKKVFFYESSAGDGKIYTRYLQGGAFSTPVDILPAVFNASYPRAVKTTDGTVWMAFNNKTLAGAGTAVYDIFYVKSTDGMLTWTQPAQFTSYVGYDSLRSISAKDNLPVVSYFSTRNSLYNHNKNLSLYYGILSQSVDNNNNAVILSVQNKIITSPGNMKLNIRAELDGLFPSDVKYIRYTIDSGTADSLILYDDGVHNDSVANDKIYGNSIPVEAFQTVKFSVNIKRDNLIGRSEIYSVYAHSFNAGTTFNIDINKIRMPINNSGTLADVNIPVIGTLGKYEESSFLFSGGFFITGFKGIDFWGNGQATALLVEDYVPGPVGSIPEDPRNAIFHVYRDDPPFSVSWQEWKYAVNNGAEFYDGDLNGIYNPVDLNSNGLWDTNEDKPLIIGDLTAWCVYNDGQLHRDRFPDQVPQQLEIQQTIFASHTNDQKTNNILFMRYKLINKNFNHQKFSSMYFSFWADPDLGSFVDDLVGCDTLLSLGMCYNDGPDNSGVASYGANPPAFFTQLLQGPKVYIPGVTFIDNNGNGIFDEGTDTSLDTAVAKLGPELGIKEYPGARNQDINSFIHYQASDPVLGDPNTVIELKNYQLGKTKIGEFPDPCTWTLGSVRGGVNCSEINRAFWYSGDPVANTGWINIRPTDQRTMLSVGPFDIDYGNDVEIMAAYIVGRGASALNSITVAREIAAYSKVIYNGNFINLPLNVDDINSTISDYQLYQNYPNPFNPSTKIRYSVGGANGSYHKVSLKIFDILGRELAVLVDESKTSGYYEISFNSSVYNLASGVFFYQLKVDDFSSVRKMMILK